MDDPACGPLLGLVPMGKFVFSHEDALEQKGKIQDLLPRMGVRYVNIDDTVPDGMVRDLSHVRCRICSRAIRARSDFRTSHTGVPISGAGYHLNPLVRKSAGAFCSAWHSPQNTAQRVIASPTTKR
ncbi:MAG: hypothetical protein ACLFWL_14110 [Candidatus Brocadiia bacterium]